MRPTRVRRVPLTIVCARCGVSVDIISATRKYCNSCASIVRYENRKRYHATPVGHAALLEGQIRYRLKNPDKVAKWAAVHYCNRRKTSLADFPSVFSDYHRLKWPCASCKSPYEVINGRRPPLDHIIPLCLGGTNDMSNLQPLCEECHNEKTVQDLRLFANKKAA